MTSRDPRMAPAAESQPAAGLDGDSRPPRVLLTKVGLDGHDRGSRIVAAWLRDAGMDVIYTPPWQTIDAVVSMASQEDVDVIAISSLATDHLIVPKLMIALRAAELGHVPVVVGGIVPRQEEPLLVQAGVRAIFGPGSARDAIVDCVRSLAMDARRAATDGGDSA